MAETHDLRTPLAKAERLNVESAATVLPREAVRAPEFPLCGYQDDRYAYSCATTATVADMETGCSVCPVHFGR